MKLPWLRSIASVVCELAAAFLVAWFAWVLVEGYWNYDPVGNLLIGVVVFVLSLLFGVPAAMIFRRRGSPGWFYVVTGGVVGLIPAILFAVAIIADNYEDYLDREGQPITSLGVIWMYLRGLIEAIFQTPLGLDGLGPGAAGGLACWLTTRRIRSLQSTRG